MKLYACSCSALHYRLMHRTWWMRIFADRRRYTCYACGANLLLVTAMIPRTRKLRGRTSEQPELPMGGARPGSRPLRAGTPVHASG